MTNAVAAVAAVALSVTLVAVFPRSILVFLAFQGSMLFVYAARIPAWLRATLLGLSLLVLMPLIGWTQGVRSRRPKAMVRPLDARRRR